MTYCYIMLDKLSPPVRGLILDMDGVLWKDDTPIGDLHANFDRIHSRGLKVTLATNNATKTVEEYLEKLRGFGVTLEPWQIVNSSEATAHVLANKFGPNPYSLSPSLREGEKRGVRSRLRPRRKRNCLGFARKRLHADHRSR